MQRALSFGAAGIAVAGLVRALAQGSLTIDTGIGRSLQPLGPLSWTIAAPPEIVFDVIAEPYLGRTTRALEKKLHVWERGSDMVLAAHFTPLPLGVATTVETVRFDRPNRVEFRLVRGPVPHLRESFQLASGDESTVLTWQGELATDFWAAGRWWGGKVARTWEATVRGSLDSIRTEAERRHHRQSRKGPTSP